MAQLELLPLKEFVITLNSGEIIRGRYSPWAIKRFCDKKGLSVAQLQDRLNAENITLDDVVQTVLCAVEHKQREAGLPFKYSDFDVCEWIEEMGGFGSEDFIRLQGHAETEVEEKNSESAGENTGY